MIVQCPNCLKKSTVSTKSQSKENKSITYFCSKCKKEWAVEYMCEKCDFCPNRKTHCLNDHMFSINHDCELRRSD